MLKTFMEHRHQIKKPMTILALQQTIDLLEKKLDTDQERIDCIQLSIANMWQGLQPDKIKQGLHQSQYQSKAPIPASVMRTNDAFEGRTSGTFDL